MTTNDINWSFYVESVDGATRATIDAADFESDVEILTWGWEARDGVAAAVVKLKLANATRFYTKYQTNNPFGMGALIRVFFEGIQKFEGFVYEHSPTYGPNQRDLDLEYKDKAGLLKYAAIAEEGQTKVISKRLFLTEINSGSTIFGSPDVSGTGTSPWAEEYLVPVWSGSSTDIGTSVRIPFSEYEILYDIGAIAWRNTTVKFLGDSSSGVPFGDVQVWAQVPYYDVSDTTMRISNVLDRAFQYPSASGGLGWVSGTDFTIQSTPNDVVNRLEWVTDEGDGYAGDLITWLYDNPAVGLAPSYQIHDFNGQGIVQAKLITQDPSAAKDVEFVLDAGFPSSITNIYSRVVVVNNDTTREDISRNAVLSSGTFAFDIPGITVIGQLESVRDNAVKSAYGGYLSGNGGIFNLENPQFPGETTLMSYFFGDPQEIDTVMLNATWLWTGDEDDGFLPVLEIAVNSLKLVHTNMRITVEWSPETSPTGNDWFPIHPDLFLAEMDILGAESSWLIVEDIGLKNVKWVRLRINNPMFGKVGNSNLNDAERVMMWFINEFNVLAKGKTVNLVNGLPPQQRFVTDSGSSDRFRPDLGELVSNGSFTTTSDWSTGAGWTLQNGVADKNADGIGLLSQTVNIVSGTVYILEYDITDANPASFLIPNVGGTDGITASGSGRYYDQIVADSGTGVSFLPTPLGSRMKLDNVKLTKAIDMFRPRLTEKLEKMGIPNKTLVLEVPDVYDFSGSGSIGNRIMTTQLDFFSKENEFEVSIIPQPNLKLGDTVWHSKLNTNFFTITGLSMNYDGITTNMRIMLTDFETKVDGGA